MMKTPNKRGFTIQEADIAILRRAGVSEEDIMHSVTVAKKALELARRTNLDLDMEFVGRGALFHDLGKAKTHKIEHGKLGAEIGTALGLAKGITDLMEKHIRGGMSTKEAAELGLPVKDYALKNLEEKIVVYADRLVDIITDLDKVVSSDAEAETRFEEILKSYQVFGKNEITIARYLEYHREIQETMKKQERHTQS